MKRTAATWPARACLQLEGNAAGFRRLGDRAEQALAPRAQSPIPYSADEHMGALAGKPCKHFVDVGFAVADHRHLRRVGQRLACRLGGADPFVAFLGFDRQRLVVMRLLCLAPPDRGACKAQDRAVPGIHGQRRMHEQPDILAIADTTEATLA
ncbi:MULTISPECIES: hypothetical protein [Mesorhizobium]|uniref:hypothetical protein n=1 Tax=Mesorhizobium TaxID=68287 RepID=UPI001CD16DB8|nr:MULTISPECIES: hypothetical protein [Mesorhizobium]UQS62702.1 hypothetical protein M5D98_21385 [Mesorhizobium opportunistum]